MGVVVVGVVVVVVVVVVQVLDAIPEQVYGPHVINPKRPQRPTHCASQD